ncbi:MAG TPA: LLM class flavin-dependent oxidoreductase [Kribbellaceae bacterium]|nr:LLM class flavin-dependent oxidoreductase [Kribbellaceae bacterium]
MTDWPYGGRRMRFGLLTQPGSSWPELTEQWREAEDLGVDTAWVIDHFVGPEARPDTWYFEGWTMLAGLAALTSRIRLGVMVTGNTYRNPALLAKQAVTVDHISGGRLELGLGAGFDEREHKAYGFAFPSPGERVDMLAEAVEVITTLQASERSDYTGEYYRLDNAVFEPKPLQSPRLPLTIGATHPRMLALTARYADYWNTRLPAAEAAPLCRALDDHCRDLSRAPATLLRSVLPREDVFTSLDAVRRLVDDYRAIGFTDFVFLRPTDPGQLSVMRQAATDLFPQLRAG